MVERIAPCVLIRTRYDLERMAVEVERVFLLVVSNCVSRAMSSCRRTPSSLLLRMISTVSFACRTNEFVWLPYTTGLLACSPEDMTV